jgi:histone arginine demethylase JMJD6
MNDSKSSNDNKNINDNKSSNNDYDGLEEPPNYKWFLLGAKYSGSPLHVDPLHTSAWNTLVKGKKLWVVLEPDEHEPISEVPDADANINNENSNNSSSNGSSSSSTMYTPKQFFTDVLPQMILSSSHHAVNNKKIRTRKFYHFVQLPGETVYVPFGMPHAVLNTEISVAITHNFVKKSNKVQSKRFKEALLSRSR